MLHKNVLILPLIFSLLHFGNMITVTAEDEVTPSNEPGDRETFVNFAVTKKLDNTSGAESGAIVFDSTDNQSSCESSPSSQLVYIPENTWRTPDMEGRELTEEIAEKYPRGNFLDRNIKNTAWGINEHLIFQINYGFYQAGTATMSVLGTKEVNGGTCYHIQTTATSNKFISTFYKVRDRVDSYIDIKGLFSRRLEKRLREGKYKSDRIVDFYPDRLIALNTQKKYALTEIPLYVQDILSALYYLRTFNLEVGRTETLDVYADGKVYPLKVIVHEKEKVKVPAGTFNCLKVEPILKSEGIFKQKGRLTVWLSDDELKVPVKMTSRIIVGSIGSNLESYQYGTIE